MTLSYSELGRVNEMLTIYNNQKLFIINNISLVINIIKNINNKLLVLAG